ncbi:MAG: HEPN domain-containing protein [Alphaproteobacteria bacterium]|nr:HEPN domain-containing protein [Alphaproteobacteria bacterium]
MTSDATRTLQYALDFFAAAIDVDENLGRHHPDACPSPVYFLTGQSLELALKSGLLLSGISANKVRRFGHDLMELFGAAKSEGLAFEDDLSGRLSILNKHYLSQEFRYPKPSEKELLYGGPLVDLSLHVLAAPMAKLPHKTTTTLLASPSGQYVTRFPTHPKAGFFLTDRSPID